MKKLILIISIILSSVLLKAQMQPLYVSSLSSAYDTDAQAYFDAVDLAGGTLTDDEKSRINTFVVGIKSDGLWTKLYAYYPYRGDGANSYAIDLKRNFDGTFVNTVAGDFTTNGWTANGSTSYMNTNLTPSVSLSLNDASMGVSINTDIAENADDIGAWTAASARLVMSNRRADGSIRVYMYTTTDNDGAIYYTNSNSIGNYVISRVANNDLRLFKNGSQIDITSTGTTVGSLPTTAIYVGCSSQAGIATQFSMKRYTGVFISSGLTPSEVSSLNSRITTLESDR